MPNGITKQAYDLLKESFLVYPGNIERAANAAGVKWYTARRYYQGGGNKLPNGWLPLKQVIEQEQIQANAERVAQEAAQDLERERLAKEAENARKLEEEATLVDSAALRTLRKTTLGGLVALAGMTEGINKLATRIGAQLAAGVDKNGQPLNVDANATIKILRDYSLTVGRLASVVDVIASMKRVEQGLPTAIMGIDVAHVTLQDAEREVEFAQDALKRARNLGLIVSPEPPEGSKH